MRQLLIAAIVTCSFSVVAPAAEFIPLGDLPGAEFGSYANGVSADGTVVVGYSRSANGAEAFRWTSSVGMVGLGDLPGGVFESEARGISADGSVIVGGSLSAAGNEAFRWTFDGGMQGLGDLPDGLAESVAIDVSGDGSVIVGTGYSTAREAFRWTVERGMIGLGFLPLLPQTSRAFAASGDGSVVVGQSGAAFEQSAFVWDADHEMQAVRDLLIVAGIDMTGWQLTSALDVSADGKVIVGHGTNPNGQPEGWIADLSIDIPGDTDRDGDVDLDDLNNVRNNFGADGTPILGDTNGDNTVDIEDLNAVRNNFGTGSAQAVPEPSACGLFLVLFTAALAMRYRGMCF